MKIISALLVLCCLAGEARADWFGLASTATSPTAKTAAPANSGQEMKAARVRWLDKQTNRLQTIVMQAGTAQTPGGINVVMTKCLADYGGVPGQDVAWLEVREGGRDAPWFAGWMFNTFPEVATLDHPRYDLQLVGCGEQPRRKAVVPVKAIEAKDAKPLAADTEAPHDSESGTGSVAPGSDPYYVPGVENPAQETPAPEGAMPAVPPVPQGATAAPTATYTAPQEPMPVLEPQRVQALPTGSVDDPAALQQLMDDRPAQ